MNWDKAVDAMRAGHSVNRRSQLWARQSDGDATVIETGMEACRVMDAWSVDDKPVRIFVGSDSRCLFVPDSDMLTAADWQVVS